MRKSILIIGLFVFILNDKLSSQTWSALGSGIGWPFGFGVVYASAMYNGELYAAGYFDSASGITANNIAKWNGADWSPVGLGLVSSDPYLTSVSSLCVYNGELYAAGIFDTAGGIAAKNIAKWNGISWSAVGTVSANSITSLSVYNGELYVAAFFPSINGIEASIAKWNGVNWSTVGTGIFSLLTSINCLAVYNGSLYAGGTYDWGGVSSYCDIAKWDGTNWSLLNSQIGLVYSMAEFNGELYAGGYFTSAGGVPANQIAKWNGINWSAVGSGIDLYSDGYWGSSVNTLAVYNGSLYAGGYFYSAGAVSTTNIAKWDGTNWSGLGLGTDYWVSSFAPTDSGIYVGGWFNYVGNNIIAHKIAKWTDSCFIPPLMPGQINGDQNVCPAVEQTYFIDPVEGAEDYTWNLPIGWTGNSTSTSITVYTGTNGGLISVVANNSCGNSIAQTINVTVDSGPQQPGIINGNDTICTGSTQTYFIDPVAGAASYIWNLPAGWSGISNSPTITVQAGSNSGSISVVANSNCGASVPQTMFITSKSTPAMPALIYGSDTICDGSTQTYFIDPVPEATGYAWDFTFGTAIGVASTEITITAHNAVVNPGDFITVSAHNICGNSDMLTLPVKVNHLPYQPNRIFGNNLVCRGSNEIYFIDPVPGATSYTWVIPSGWNGNSNTSSINVNVGNEKGDVSVRANNSCGSGAFKSLQVLFDTIPSKPELINGNAYVAISEKHGYSVDITNRPLGYNWSLNGGGNLTGGQSPNKIEIDWQTPGTYVLSVSATNSCGVSLEQKMNIIVSAPNEKDPYGLQIFPNPSNGQFLLKAKRLQDKWIDVEVLSMSGQLVFARGKSMGSNNYSQLIDLDKLARGTYAVKIVVDGKTFIKPVVIAW